MVPKLWVSLLRCWGRCLKVTLQTHALKNPFSSYSTMYNVCIYIYINLNCNSAILYAIYLVHTIWLIQGIIADAVQRPCYIMGMRYSLIALALWTGNVLYQNVSFDLQDLYQIVKSNLRELTNEISFFYFFFCFDKKIFQFFCLKFQNQLINISNSHRELFFTES